MVGPILERVMSRLGDESEQSKRANLRESPLVDEHSEELEKKLRSKGEAGGCCSAAAVAQAVRRSGQRYE